MPRLLNKLTGAVMSVPESVVGRLGGEWVDADKASEKPAPRRKANGTESKPSE